MPSLNPVLRDFWLQPGIRNRVLYGGRDSTKTWDAAGMAVYLASTYRIRLLATREFQNRISDSVFTVLVDTIQRFGMSSEFDIGATTITHRRTGSDFLFYGRSRNINEIKGLERIDIHWSEESELLTEDQWGIIDP
ncbi:MAG: PBSX family phage terminase large subunit, partial [Ferrovum sp.]|nr:PBSX family phage terminase large subunit [Ferrovum sp.]